MHKRQLNAEAYKRQMRADQREHYKQLLRTFGLGET
jgi:hypothetical protein